MASVENAVKDKDGDTVMVDTAGGDGSSETLAKNVKEKEMHTSTKGESDIPDDEEKMDTSVHEETVGKTNDASTDKKQQKNIQATKEIKPSIIHIQDQVGKIFRSYRYEPILIQFQYYGKDEVALAMSTSMYINGSQSLLRVCRNDMMMKGFLTEGDTVNFDAYKKKVNEPQKGKEKEKKRNNQPSHHWEVTLMWKGEKPDMAQLNTGVKFDAQDTYLEAKVKQLELLVKEDQEFKENIKGCTKWHGEVKEILSETHGTMKSTCENAILFKRENLLLDGKKMSEEQKLADVLNCGDKVSAYAAEKSEEYGSVTYTMIATYIWKSKRVRKFQEWDKKNIDVPECWFMVSSRMIKQLPAYEEATEKDQIGEVKEIHRPKGGIISLQSGKDVVFSRTRLFIDNKRLDMMDTLDEIEVGDTVHCDIYPNEDRTYMDSPLSHVALLVWKGQKDCLNHSK